MNPWNRINISKEHSLLVWSIFKNLIWKAIDGFEYINKLQKCILDEKSRFGDTGITIIKKKCTILKRMYYTKKKRKVHSKKSIKIEQFRII